MKSFKGYVEAFVCAYRETALWSSTDEDGTPLDENFGVDDLSSDAKKEMRSACEDFIRANHFNLSRSGLTPGRAGHDFWLTRNGHGAGFWDEGLGALGDALTRASKPYGSLYLYRGDDGALHMN